MEKASHRQLADMVNEILPMLVALGFVAPAGVSPQSPLQIKLQLATAVAFLIVGHAVAGVANPHSDGQTCAVTR